MSHLLRRQLVAAGTNLEVGELRNATEINKPDSTSIIGGVFGYKYCAPVEERPSVVATFDCADALLSRRLMSASSKLGERTDGDVVAVRIPEREFLGSRIRVRVRLLLEPGYESACAFQGPIEIVDAKEQEEPVAWCGVVPACQRRMIVRAPLVEAEQDSSIRIEDLTKVIMGRTCLGLAEERLIPFEAGRHIAYTDDRPRAFHDISPAGLAPELLNVRTVLILQLPQHPAA
jgi:hypothetical protein